MTHRAERKNIRENVQGFDPELRLLFLERERPATGSASNSEAGLLSEYSRGVSAKKFP